MKWKTQIEIIRKILEKLYFVFKEFSVLILFTLRYVYFALVQSLLVYGISQM